MANLRFCSLMGQKILDPSFTRIFLQKKVNTRLSDCPLSFLHTGGRVITYTSRDSERDWRFFSQKSSPPLSIRTEGTVTRDAVSSLWGSYWPPSWNFVNYARASVQEHTVTV